MTTVDTAALATYCQTYAHWRESEEALDTVAAKDPTMHGLLIKTVEGNARRNPLVKVAADAANDMMRHASQFGFTPASRNRISIADTAAPESKFGPLLIG